MPMKSPYKDSVCPHAEEISVKGVCLGMGPSAIPSTLHGLLDFGKTAVSASRFILSVS